MNIYFVNDTGGYRTEASKYILENVPQNSNIIMPGRARYQEIDITYAERKLEKEHSQYYKYIHANTEDLKKINISGFAIYNDKEKIDLPVLKSFQTPLLAEQFYFRLINRFVFAA